jgi:hypothetical protein
MLSKQQLQVCSSLGISPHQFIEVNSENLSGMAAQAAQDELEQQARVHEAEQAVMKLMNISPAELKHLQSQSAACTLTFEETEVCQKMGILPVDYLAEKMKAAGVYETPDGVMKIK